MRTFNVMAHIICVILLFSCVSKNARDYSPKPIFSADTSGREVSFENDVNPIIQSRCVSCHRQGATDPNSPGYAFLTDYRGTYKYATEKYGGSSLSKLEERIRSTSEDFRMPYKLPPLSPDQIQLISTWIAQGAKDN